MRGWLRNGGTSGSATAIFLPKGFSTPHQKSHDDFLVRVSHRVEIGRTTSPHLYHAFSLKASGYHLYVGHLTCTPRCCLPFPHPKCDHTLSFCGRIFHPLLFLFPDEEQYTPYDGTGLPRQPHPTLSGHSFVVALQTHGAAFGVSRLPLHRGPPYAVHTTSLPSNGSITPALSGLSLGGIPSGCFSFSSGGSFHPRLQPLLTEFGCCLPTVGVPRLG
jgi:hypothetical protein